MKGKIFGSKKKETKPASAKTAQSKTTGASKPAPTEKAKPSSCCG